MMIRCYCIFSLSQCYLCIVSHGSTVTHWKSLAVKATRKKSIMMLQSLFLQTTSVPVLHHDVTAPAGVRHFLVDDFSDVLHKNL
mmetsp:Transcript_64366/g.134318  ORF Transcript_64366/g.134318 Transcript_64366/m.134318 type:complete len:84 (-) Transcript_64366:1532-1783(-)